MPWFDRFGEKIMHENTHYRDKPEHHRHKCPRCGCVWEHHWCNVGIDPPHLCPRCETEQREPYRGDYPPELYHGKPPPEV